MVSNDDIYMQALNKKQKNKPVTTMGVGYGGTGGLPSGEPIGKPPYNKKPKKQPPVSKNPPMP